MKAHSLPLLRDPSTRERLELISGRSPDGSAREWLVGMESGSRYRVVDGIPVFREIAHPVEREERGPGRGGLSRLADLPGKLSRLLPHGQSALKKQAEAYSAWLEELGVRDGDRLLEVGTGTGLDLLLPAGKFDYFCLGTSLRDLRRLTADLGGRERDAYLFQGAVERLPFVDGAFDTVFNVGGMTRFEDRKAAVREMIRVAKPGARILIAGENDSETGFLGKITSVKKPPHSTGETRIAPVDPVPANMMDMERIESPDGRLYRLTFRKPRYSVYRG